jgi:hypothetical protein
MFKNFTASRGPSQAYSESYNEEGHHFYSSLYIFGLNGDSVRIIETGCATCMGDTINECRTLVEKPEGGGYWGILRSRKENDH